MSRASKTEEGEREKGKSRTSRTRRREQRGITRAEGEIVGEESNRGGR
jgi:hypothetical protein